MKMRVLDRGNELINQGNGISSPPRGTWGRDGRAYHVNENIQLRTVPFLDQLGCVVLLPLLLLVFAKVALERLLAPGAVDRVSDWGECRDGFVFAGVAEELHGS